jgi:hypothetical protein
MKGDARRQMIAQQKRLVSASRKRIRQLEESIDLERAALEVLERGLDDLQQKKSQYKATTVDVKDVANESEPQLVPVRIQIWEEPQPKTITATIKSKRAH